MSNSPVSTNLDNIRRELAAKPDGILEATASQYGLSLQATVECLPAHMWTRVPGSHFVDVLQDVSEWGDVVVIQHTKDVILEVEAPLPKGTLGHGFYNLAGGSALSGHLRADNCKAILFLRRPFMGKETLSIQFFNADGEAMFKVFVGRDENRALKTAQAERFATLESRLAGVVKVH